MANTLRKGHCFAVGLGALLGMLVLSSPVSAGKAEKHFNVEVRPVVTIRNVHGRISVKSWDRPEVVVAASYPSSKLEVDTEQVGNRIEVGTHFLSEPQSTLDRQADFEITVPEETELQVRNDSGLVVVERVFGDMMFDTVAADVQLQQVAGYLVVRTVSGSVTCRMCAGGRLEINSVGGQIHLYQPESSLIRANTTTGNILYDGSFRRGASYFFRNYSGLIEVRFSPTDSFSVKATSIYGKVENEANVVPRGHARVAPTTKVGNSLFGDVNEGHAKVEITSFNGTIRLLKRE